jgi:hypothetical protein
MSAENFNIGDCVVYLPTSEAAVVASFARTAADPATYYQLKTLGPSGNPPFKYVGQVSDSDLEPFPSTRAWPILLGAP